MTTSEMIDEIKLELTGGILKLEIPDETLKAVVDKALREVQRYIDTTKIITVPYSKCIDLDGMEDKISAITNVFRIKGYLFSDGEVDSSQVDPMWIAQWNIFNSSGDMYNLSNWLQNYGAWNTMLQIRNTSSTDLSYYVDKPHNKLYINTAFDYPEKITIEYIPVFHDVSEVTSDYWKDIILRLSVALTKQILGRIRTRFTQSNALLGMDGEKLLEEGNKELEDLREKLRVNSQLMYPKD